MRNTALSSLIPETTEVDFSRESEEMGIFMEKLPFLSFFATRCAHEAKSLPVALSYWWQV